MGYMSEKLWDVFVKKVEEEDVVIRKEHRLGNEYVSAVKKICKYGVERAETIRDTFPMFTLHNETHICNVMQLMADLLGDHLEKLTRDEAAMLIMSACCHDIGMSYSEEEKKELINDDDRLYQYLENNDREYVKAYSAGNTVPMMTDEMIQNYLRSIHHERVRDLLSDFEWPGVLEGKIDRENLICVCQSHGKNITALDEMEATATIDLRFCAILLRLADILDFDTSRAPEAVYQYSGFQKAEDANAIKSKEEWDKHLASHGFDFLHLTERIHMYSLDYSATCKSMQVEQTVNCYLDWVDQELNDCGRQLKRFAGRWQNFILPGKIKRNIKSEGYVSGQYRLSLDQDKILELLIGRDLYSDPAVFVRELIQNAIDAVRTREQLDKNLPSGWKGQINIRSWMDEEGYHWFRIEDNGIGMTEDVIMNHFLKIGSSYYSSDAFSKSKLQCSADPDYMPISRFGIGILSCFMGDEQVNQVEVSTKHFKEGETYYPALRLSMHGINGYYYLANKDKQHRPDPMKGVTQKEQARYLTQAGTVIAVRANLYQTGKYRRFKEIVDRYVVYPPVAIHYDGEEESCDYLTEKDFMDAVNSIYPSDNLEESGLKEFSIPDEKLEELYRKIPELSFENPPKLLLKCVSLEKYTSTPFLKGALLVAKVDENHKPISVKLSDKYVKVNVMVRLNIDENRDKLGIRIGMGFNYDFDMKDDITALETYKALQDEWVCEICSLSELEWYNKYFKNIINKAGIHSVAVHNGILCGNANFFFDEDIDENLAAILLLKDKYRPHLDVARDGVRGLPLEAASELTIIGRSLVYQGFVRWTPELSEETDFYRAMADYCELLKRREDLAKQLAFVTSEGLLSIENLPDTLLKKGTVGYRSYPRLSYRISWSQEENLYRYLCSSFLRKNYLLQTNFGDYDKTIFISKKEKELSDDYQKLFPACFFLPDLNKNSTILTMEDPYRRYACNEYHRLSQFILKNGMALKKHVPGILKELLQILAEEDGKTLIDSVNSLLEDLRKFSGGLFQISDELFLSEQDLR